MEKYYVVTMSDGKKWGVPAHVIAKNKADYYYDGDDTEWNEEYNAMMKWFDANDYEFADWAKSNMNWTDVQDIAVLLEEEPQSVDFEECWVNGDYDYVSIN